MFQTAGRRLFLWNVAVLTIILIFFGGLAYFAFDQQIYADANNQLESQDRLISQSLVADSGNLTQLAFAGVASASPFGPPPLRTVVADAQGRVNLSSECLSQTIYPTPQNCSFTDAMLPTSQAAMREVATSGGVDVRTATFRGVPYRTRTFVFACCGVQYIIQTSRPAQGEEEALHAVKLVLILAGAFGVLLAGLASMFLANRALVPIRQAFARQRQFTADASHELRTPLALIRANAEMLERSSRLEGGDTELVTEIINETDHLNRLVGDLLTLARADAESSKLASKPVDLRDLVTGVHEDLHLIAESRGIDSAISVNGPLIVPGDEGRLRQLLLILLDNALKYTDPGGRVDVAIQRDDNRAKLVISDTGIGIPTEDLPHIFDRFYRVDRAREHESGGTGLGLAIAQWIVQAHRGTIKVDSQVGRGTSFVIDLPT
jgi:two-component system, OmpR family, sensor histidine kinase CiaH